MGDGQRKEKGTPKAQGQNLNPKCLYWFLIHRFKLGLHFFTAGHKKEKKKNEIYMKIYIKENIYENTMKEMLRL